MSLSDLGAAPLWRRWETWAVLVWAGSLLVVCTRVALDPKSRTVYYPAYVEAGRNWRDGQDLYKSSGGYRYCPPVTVLFAGLSHLPHGAAGILWRVIGVVAFLGAMGWWAKTGLPRTLSRSEVGLLFLLAAPLALSSLNNGQANILLAGLLVLSVTSSANKRWNLAAVCLTLAILLKAYPIALALLLVAQYPRQLGWRVPLAMAVGMALPFLFQNASYVSQQYQGWLGNLKSDDRSAFPLEDSYRDLWLLCRVWSVPLGQQGYVVLQLGGAAAVATVCLAGKWLGWEQRRLLTILLALATCWMMLLGPATESCTYTLLAPCLAWGILESYTDRRFFWARGPVTISYATLLVAFAAGWFPVAGTVHALGIHPLGTLVFTGVVLGQGIACLRRTRPATECQTPSSAAQAA
jgi:hypothetical protein